MKPAADDFVIDLERGKSASSQREKGGFLILGKRRKIVVMRAEEGFDVPRRAIASLDPDHLGRRPDCKAELMEVGVL